MTTLHTQRLILRPLADADADAYVAMRYHPAVARWLIGAPDDPVQAARRSIAAFSELWAKDGHAPWGLFLKDGGSEGRLIGHGGLRIIPEYAATEILYALHPDAWGQGYASELGEASLRFGFEQRKLPFIFAITKPDNGASQGVMKRLGMSYRKNTIYKDIEAVWFEIDAVTWAGRQGVRT